MIDWKCQRFWLSLYISPHVLRMDGCGRMWWKQLKTGSQEFFFSNIESNADVCALSVILNQYLCIKRPFWVVDPCLTDVVKLQLIQSISMKAGEWYRSLIVVNKDHLEIETIRGYWLGEQRRRQECDVSEPKELCLQHFSSIRWSKSLELCPAYIA